MEPGEIDIGRVVAGKYELVRLVGKGAMGEVWLATHNSLGGEFAIKLVKPSDDEEDETAAGRFQLEAQVSAKLSRKTRHIVSVSDHGEEDGLAYLVMELLEGESLDARIKRVGPLPLPEVVAIVMQIARALTQAHAEQIFHRDLKPANVFLTRDEDGRLLVKLLDFGIARSARPFRTRSPFMTGKDMVLGTPSYMSPEQARGLDTLDHRCDLWALAVVAYESLTREIPWEGDTVEDIFLSICTHRMIPIHARRRDLPPALDGIFTRSFTPKLDERFRAAGELSDAFELLVDPAMVDAAMGPPRAPASSRRLLQQPNTPQHTLRTPRAAPVPVDLRTPRAQPSPLAMIHHTPGEMALANIPSPHPAMGAEHPAAATKRSEKRSSGWLIVALACVGTLAIVVFAVRTFGSRRATASAESPTSSVTASDRAAPPIPPAAPSLSAAAIAAPASASPPIAKTTVAPPSRPTAATGRGAGAPPAPNTAAAPPVPAPPQPPPPPVVMPQPPPAAPASTPPPTPARPRDKAEVF